MACKLDIRLQFQCHSPFHITGERAELYTDKALLLSWQGDRAAIPATSIKGWLRDNIERSLRGLKLDACDSSKPDLLCGRCLVCQIFGHPYRCALLRFSDAIITEESRDVRMNVSLSRYRRASYEERLFSTELAWVPGFSCEADGLFDDAQMAQTAASLVHLGARIGFALGAARSRGLGWVTMTHYEARLDGQLLDNQMLIAHLQELIKARQGSVT